MEYRAFVEPANTAVEMKQLCACIQRNVRNSPPNNPPNITRFDSLQRKCGTPFTFSADLKFDCNTYVFHS